MSGGNNNSMNGNGFGFAPMSGSNTYNGKPLTGQVTDAYGGALGGADAMASFGAGAAGSGFNMANDAANGFKNAGTVAGADLNPYKNPFQNDVIKNSMDEIGRRHDVQSMNLDDAATRAHAFGGDRFAIQQGANDRDYMKLKAQTISDLNMKNFTNAQTLAQGDINNKMGQASGQANIASMLSQLGLSGATNGNTMLGNFANLGFGMGQTVAGNEATSGALQQSIMQKIIDAANQQYGGYTNQDSESLKTLISGLPGVGSAGTQTQSSNPGVMGILGGLTSLIGLL